MDAVQTPIIPTIGALIRETPGTISLGQGVAHYGPPRAATEAVARALADPSTNQYQPVAGIPQLLERLAAKLLAENRIDVRQGYRLMVTAGANMAFCHAVQAITVPGDEIILNTPYYFNHEMAIRIADCVPVSVATDENYQPRVDALAAAITSRTRAIVTVTPNNPTGAVYDEARLREINALCRERGLYHFCDETYEYFTYGAARHFSPGSLPGSESHTISMYSLSKAYGFRGLAGRLHGVPRASRRRDGQDPGHRPHLRAGGITGGGYSGTGCWPRLLRTVRARVGRSARHRPVATFDAGASRARAEDRGRFYCFLKVDTAMNDMALAERLIREHRVAVIPE
jgi:aspartate/methionine/tyrosine aminotransferase